MVGRAFTPLISRAGMNIACQHLPLALIRPGRQSSSKYKQSDKLAESVYDGQAEAILPQSGHFFLSKAASA